MSREGDVEDQHVPHEETSLLSHGQSNQEQQHAPGPNTTVGARLRYRILWVVLGIVLLTVFIKGWIDAGSDVDFDLNDALRKALGGGLSGAAAMILQVLLFMPLRTIMNYQYRFGTSFRTASRTLYQRGGVGRYYQGITVALFQGPLARFGDTAANAGILALLHSNSYLKGLPSPVKTIFASLCAAGFRMVLTPIDTLKTTLQAQGSDGTDLLRQRFKKYGVLTLWWGAFATAGATFVGHYPWFATYNFLIEIIQEPPKTQLFLWLFRYAIIGFIASIISDSVSNSLRVVKTYRQVNDTQVSYSEAVKLVIRDDGVSGLLGRGLPTRILCNGLQGVLFSVLWKLFLDLWEQKTGS